MWIGKLCGGLGSGTTNSQLSRVDNSPGLASVSHVNLSLPRIFSMFKMVQPSKVLYLAVDGVAPRAKMNQQRSRRFRSAKDAERLASELNARDQAAAVYNGAAKQAGQSQLKVFDSNCITPGTDFMLKLSFALQKWVSFKMESDLFWKSSDCVVIVSGPDVPGEGEHKVMDFIRETRQAVLNNEKYGDSDVDPSHFWQPNFTHVLYGLDADLIMLGLVTHEPNFMLLREKMSVVMAGRGRSKYRKKKDMLDYTNHDFEVLELSALRQMLSYQFHKFANDFKERYDLNRIVDDFVFMCMMVGNDFLPHCPHLEIDSGALSLMMSNYIDLLPDWGGYLTKKEKIHPKRFEQLLYQLSAYEEEHFKRRGYEENEPGWKLSAENEEEAEDFYGTFFGGSPTPAVAVPANRKGSKPPESGERPMAPSGNRAFRRMHPGCVARSYRDFYYETKLGWKTQDRNRTLFKRREHVREYIEGLHWVLNYYHNGCKSWDWFFPYLYSPLATDLVNLEEFYDSADDEGFASFEFDQGEPFPSLAQLLSVLPPQSASLLPKPFAELMIHPSSPLTHFYPNDFTSDPNGKRQTWEAVVQIPFIDADVLLDTVQQIMDKDRETDLLTNSERKRNVPGKQHVFKSAGLTDEEREKYEEQLRRPSVVSSSPERRRRAEQAVQRETATSGGNRKHSATSGAQARPRRVKLPPRSPE